MLNNFLVHLNSSYDMYFDRSSSVIPKENSNKKGNFLYIKSISYDGIFYMP